MRRRLIAGMLALAVAPTAHVASAGEIAHEDRRSSYDQMAPETRAMQDEDTANPGMLAVLEGKALWGTPAGAAARACADCHGEPAASMKGVAARHPAFDPERGGASSLEMRINRCRSERQGAAAFPFESRELLGLTALIARQSRGAPITSRDPRLEPVIEAGRALYRQRQGQLNLACAHCHDDNWGGKLAGNPIPQGHPTGYPVYRLEWQALGSLQRRLRNCLSGMRAENFPLGSPELLALETYLMWRARGMRMESPGVRP